MAAVTEYETVWSGTIETEAIRSAQLPPPVVVPNVGLRSSTARERVRSFLKRHPNAPKRAIIDNLDLTKDVVGDALSYLRRVGVIERVDLGSGRSALWRLK